MQFVNEFDVEAPVDEVWDALLDVERVAPCVPGAEVMEKTDDDAYKVAIKVRVGPISMTYRGQVQIVEQDAERRHAVMNARAREARGQGTADADVAMDLEQRDGLTHGTITADVQLSGRAAAMGRGVIQDVSGKLVETFAGNLAEMLQPAPAEAAASAAEAPRPSPPQDELQAGAIVRDVAAERLLNPRTVVIVVGALVGLWILRRALRR
jgi:carbon monoxide dehydrogenase subunit G